MLKNILLTVIGGLGLLVTSSIMSSMFSAPVSQADFDTHKADSTRHLKSIDDKLEALQSGQTLILGKLIKGR